MNTIFKERLKNILKSDELPLVITHKNCQDGTGSVLAIADIFQVLPSELTVKYCQYNEDFSEILYTTHENIIMCDFSFTKEELIMLDENSENLVVIDHHKSAEDTLSSLPFTHFDMNESGATLTWKCLSAVQGDNTNNEIPMLLEYIKDRDIWNWNLPDSKEISAALTLFNKFEPDTFMDYLYDPYALIESGKSILAYQNQSVDKATKAYKKKDFARFIAYNGTKIPFINATTLLSEIGNKLSASYQFAIMYFFTHDSIVLSMRSSEDNPKYKDVSEVCKQFGGGGHKHASGCSFKLSEEPERLQQLFIEQILK